MHILSDIYDFFEFLNFVDIVFLTAIITLLILIVTLIYFIKINKDYLGEDDFFPKVKEENMKLNQESNANIIYEGIDNKPKEVNQFNEEEPELIDLASLEKKLKEENNGEIANITDYEKDQEEKAIISYDELLKQKNKFAINYEKEEILDDLVVKKVDLKDFANKNNIEVMNEDIRVISYQKEEAFLNALKELNSLLN